MGLINYVFKFEYEIQAYNKEATLWASLTWEKLMQNL